MVGEHQEEEEEEEEDGVSTVSVAFSMGEKKNKNRGHLPWSRVERFIWFHAWVKESVLSRVLGHLGW